MNLKTTSLIVLATFLVLGLSMTPTASAVGVPMTYLLGSEMGGVGIQIVGQSFDARPHVHVVSGPAPTLDPDWSTLGYQGIALVWGNVARCPVSILDGGCLFMVCPVDTSPLLC